MTTPKPPDKRRSCNWNSYGTVKYVYVKQWKKVMNHWKNVTRTQALHVRQQNCRRIPRLNTGGMWSWKGRTRCGGWQAESPWCIPRTRAPDMHYWIRQSKSHTQPLVMLNDSIPGWTHHSKKLGKVTLPQPATHLPQSALTSIFTLTALQQFPING